MNKKICLALFALFSFTVLAASGTPAAQDRYDMVKEPSFVGGDEAMYQWIVDNLQYPSRAKCEGVSGIVKVAFDIDSQGYPDFIEVLEGVHPLLDKEAMRLVENMPRFSPMIVRQNGKEFPMGASRFVVPIIFSLTPVPYNEGVSITKLITLDFDEVTFEEEVVANPALTELLVVQENEVMPEIIDGEATRELGSVRYEGTEDLNLEAVKREIVEVAPRSDVDRKQEERPVPLAMVEQRPVFPEGDRAMYEWLGQNIVYPAQAREDGAQGKVVLEFIVEKDGSLSHVRVVRGRHPALDAEAVRVVKKMPKWIPGRNLGVPVRVTYMLPVTFKL